MAQQSCINHDTRAPFVAIRLDYLALCEGRDCAAAILNNFEQWMNAMERSAEQASTRNKIAAVGGVPADQDEDLWFYHSQAAIGEDLFNLYGRNVIGQNLDYLVKRGFVLRRRNPKFGWDRTWQYSLNVEAVQAGLDDLPPLFNFKQWNALKRAMESPELNNPLPQKGQAIQQNKEQIKEQNHNSSASTPAPSESVLSGSPLIEEAAARESSPVKEELPRRADSPSAPPKEEPPRRRKLQGEKQLSVPEQPIPEEADPLFGAVRRLFWNITDAVWEKSRRVREKSRADIGQTIAALTALSPPPTPEELTAFKDWWWQEKFGYTPPKYADSLSRNLLAWRDEMARKAATAGKSAFSGQRILAWEADGTPVSSMNRAGELKRKAVLAKITAQLENEEDT